MAYNPGSYNYGGITAVTPQQAGAASYTAARPMSNAPGYIPNNYTDYFAPSAYSSAGGQLADFQSMSPDALLALRTKYRIATNAPSLAENARQFDVGNATNQSQFLANLAQNQGQFSSNLGENARQFDIGNLLKNDQFYSQLGEGARQFDVGNASANDRAYASIANDQMLAELQTWLKLASGLT